MKRIYLLLAAGITLSLPIQSFAQGHAYWAAKDAGQRGNLKGMLAELNRAKIESPVRFNQSYEHLASVLEKNGRFKELGLSTDEGRVLLHAMFKKLGLPESPAVKNQPNEKSSATVVTLPGYQPRGEFEPIAAVLMTWPQSNNLVDEYLTMIRTILKGDAWIYMWVNTSAQQRKIQKKLDEAGIDQSHMSYLKRPLNSMWMRDYGPIFIYDGSGNWALTDFHYYRQRALDDSTPKYFSALFNVPRVDRQSRDNQVFTEGGNLMTDGRGAIVYSTRTYSNNSRTDPSVIDVRIGSGLQAVKAIVPEDPSLDGTGHVDMFMKIIGSNTVVIGQYNPGQTDYQVLEDNAALFAGSTNGDGQPWNVIRLPQPDVYYVLFLFPVVRTYTNGLMVNDQVIVPVYGLPEDATALNIFANALPGRTIVPINANDIIEQAGAWHCVTMEYPAP